MSNKTSRYRVLASVEIGSHANEATREFVSKGNTIFQCDTLDEALNQIKVISENHPECTKFDIERGEWL